MYYYIYCRYNYNNYYCCYYYYSKLRQQSTALIMRTVATATSAATTTTEYQPCQYHSTANFCGIKGLHSRRLGEGRGGVGNEKDVRTFRSARNVRATRARSYLPFLLVVQSQRSSSRQLPSLSLAFAPSPPWSRVWKLRMAPASASDPRTVCRGRAVGRSQPVSQSIPTPPPGFGDVGLQRFQSSSFPRREEKGEAPKREAVVGEGKGRKLFGHQG